jgi:energy-coupling factor transporter ATP-binding protein EcfA2
MKLDIFEYIYNQGEPNEWIVEECKLSQINLIVGKNASGKSRIVKSIDLLSKLLTESGSLRANSRKDEWHLYFDIDQPEKKTEYILKLERGLVIQEKLIIGTGTQPLLDRGESGKGKIWAEELEKEMLFQTPQMELAVVKRRDAIQHPFLDQLYEWSHSFRFYEFGTQLGKDTIARIPPTIDLLKNRTDFKDYDYVVGIFVIGAKEIGDTFTETIIEDMKKIGYNVSEIGIKVPSGLIDSDIPSPDDQNDLPQFLYVKEVDLRSITEQSEMSQGMFRALSLFIQINYSLLASKPSCIVIDDIGEGLDYQRSSSIIKLLIEKAETGLVQLIMTTNDEFIMNGVPLEYWSVIERKSGISKLHNTFNTKEKFDQFEFIGLNNFDFFTSNFHLQKFTEEE